MKTYLVGFSYHYPEDLKRWREGTMEDFEASTGIFIAAPTGREAIRWGGTVARGLHAQENPEDPDSWDKHSHRCWIEEDPDASGWKHCFSFFQRVKHGEMPDLEEMNVVAYARWQRSARNES